MQDKVTEVLSSIDVDMDYPEENLDKLSEETLINNLTEVNEEISKLLSTFSTGRVLKNGVSVAICGKPNTGKSSILNALLNAEKAIVSDVAGTTRDVVEGSLDINGVRFNFYDTAGIRESGDKIESLGVERSKKILEGSDLVLFVMDCSEINELDQEIYDLVKDKNIITVINKTDKCNNKDSRGDIYVSALKRENLENLKGLIFEKSVGNGVDYNGDFLSEERHYEALKRAKDKFEFALSMVKNAPLDIVAIDIKEGWDSLGEISGKTATEEIINDIFARFCVGK